MEYREGTLIIARLQKQGMESEMNYAEMIKIMESAWDLGAPTSITRGVLEKEVRTVAGGTSKPPGDEAQARNVARHLEGKALFVPERGWFIWDGHVWKQDAESQVTFLVRELIRERDECNIWSYSEKNGWGITPPTVGNLGNVLKALTSDPRIVATITRFDTDAYTLNTPGGLIDLTTGEVVTTRTPPLVMKTTTVAPVAGDAPLWEYTLESAFPGDPDTQEYAETALALALFGNQDVQQFWMLSGEAGSGKGTLLNCAMDLLGIGEDGYAMSVEMEFLMNGNNGGHPEKYARLYGKRLVVASEVEEAGATFSAARVKNLTGGDTITGRWMRGNSFSFKPTWKLFLMTNYRPKVSYEDAGFWRRFREIPFRHKPEGAVISNLKDRLVAEEGPAILARLIKRAQQFMTEGLYTSESVRLATLDNRAEQDHIEQFIKDECSVTASGKTEKKTFYDTYAEWCKRSKVEEMDLRAVTKRLKELGHPSSKSNNITHYNGVTVSNPVIRY